MSDMSAMEWIDTQDRFDALMAEAQTHRVVALDTEFVWTRTYYANLGVIQLSWGRDDAFLIDALAISERAGMTALLANPNVTKVFHEAGSDLPILRRWAKATDDALPQAIFDTRIAAGFAGLTARLSLKALLKELVHVSLEKTETRTDWLQRPLTDAQMEYAVSDVIYMNEACALLQARMEECGNTSFFLEEMQEFSTPQFYRDFPVEDAWLHISGIDRYHGKQLRIVQELAVTREKTARTENLPRSFVLRDEFFPRIAAKPPLTANDLLKMGVHPVTVRRHSAAILLAVQRGLHKQPDDATAQNPPLSELQPLRVMSKTMQEAHKNCVGRLLALGEKRAKARSIDPSLVIARRDAEAFVNATAAHAPWPYTQRILTGWRGELLGVETLAQLATTRFQGAL